MNLLKHKDRHSISANEPQPANMSTKTKFFIQRFCYKKTASVDMTKNGFVNGRKLHPVSLLLRPLRAQIEKMWGKHTQIPSSKKTPPPIKKHEEKGPSSPKIRKVSAKKDDKKKQKNSRGHKQKTRKKKRD